MNKGENDLLRQYFDRAKKYTIMYLDDKYDLDKVEPKEDEIADILLKFMNAVVIVDENRLNNNPFYYEQKRIYEMTHSKEQIRNRKLKEEAWEYQICIGLIQKRECEIQDTDDALKELIITKANCFTNRYLEEVCGDADQMLPLFVKAVQVVEEHRLKENPSYYVLESNYLKTHSKKEGKLHREMEDLKDYQLCLYLINNHNDKKNGKSK